MAQTPQIVLVKDIMTRAIISVDSTVTVNEAAKTMEKAGVGAVLIMEKNTPLGIMTDRDFAIKIAAHAYPIQTKVKQVMSSPLIHVSPDDEAWVAADLMYSRKVRKLPVIDGDQLLGIVTASDIVKLFTVCNKEDVRNMYYRALSKIFDNNNEEAVANY